MTCGWRGAHVHARLTLFGLIVTVATMLPARAALVAQQVSPGFQPSPFLRIDPDKIVIADATGLKPCGECHRAELDVWKATKHAKGFDDLHRSESAKSIMKEMGLRVTKRQEAVCMRCHYTVGPDRTAVAGVSCESCHGAARDWINVHNKWGGGAQDRAHETSADREQRIAASRLAGMLRPSTDLYAVAANCYECHTVPNEKLVNQSSHVAGSRTFNLVAFVDSIRHNFLSGTPAGRNRPMTEAQVRVMLVIGRMLGYEYSLRGLALATVDSTYAAAMEKRAKAAIGQMQEIADAVTIPDVVEALSIGKKVKLVPNNRAELERAADQIRAIGQRFARTANGATLIALDSIAAPRVRAQTASAPSAGEVPAARPAAAESPATPKEKALPAGAPAPVSNTPAVRPATGAATSAPSNAAPPSRADLSGELRSRPAWFKPAGRVGFAEGGECASCHRQASQWALKDPHGESAARRLFGENAKARQIADVYGIGAAGMRRADKLCMSCHGTVDEARPTVVVEQGVTCESCHGAGANYLEPHQKGNNPQAGMRPLKLAGDRAQTCAGCHRITDERLLAAGHSSGADYDFVIANNKIKHWPDPKADQRRASRNAPAYVALADAVLRDAFATAVKDRPIPKVSVVAAVPTAPVTAPATAPVTRPLTSPVSGAEADRGATPARSEIPADRRSRLAPTLPQTLPVLARNATVTLNLQPLPDTTGLTTEELLRLVKKRIEQIHAAVSRPH